MTPVVLDLTPNVLGLTEGFDKIGFEILAAIGFNPGEDAT